MHTDETHMRRALALATLGRGTTTPNPLVGAVVARGARVIGQAYHRRPGEPHAEALALAQVGSAQGATLYTNLEPCCHTGRTPPCVEEIVRSRIGRVVVAMRDPNPRVNGGGFRALRKHGIVVDIGLLHDEAFHLNEGFAKRAKTGLPFVTLKGALSLDGRIATRTGDSKWVTSLTARRHARVLRAENDAIMVGIGTALADDPRLNRRPRLPGAAPLVRVVLDGALRLPIGSRLVTTLREGPVVVFCGPNAPPSKRRRLSGTGVDVETVKTLGRKGKLDLDAVLRKLAERGSAKVLVEGGGELHASFLEQGLADRWVLYVAPRLIGGTSARPLVGGRGVSGVGEAPVLRNARCTRVGDGWMIDGELD
ncbi:MAG: bifunctional diaminohydroxyphosphoribosylaminopyrimidine deaminase/5-amino-6-(5-phosphoribosylamino)uracil reductase RibD [Acidobacteriota bacterium]|nr:MAG: bifunctional diaminohydroxyphosphoribosylaminopyrimidine deaminase/5-amino-6-(5-phosphoribosylamino)uracil reductase RibD [Acidobacteriota bacterium]